MITLTLSFVALWLCLSVISRRTSRARIKTAAESMSAGFVGAAGLALCGLLFESPPSWAFTFVVAFGTSLAAGHARQRREAERRQTDVIQAAAAVNESLAALIRERNGGRA